MGLARDLTMGPKRPRGVKAGTGGPWEVIKQCCRISRPLTADELTRLRTACETVGTPGYGGRALRYQELAIWGQGNLRYLNETGVSIGPVPGTY